MYAAADGTIFERPAVSPPYVAYVEYASPPIWYMMQSSYAHVESELNVMRNAHPDKFILFVGGDGLSILRLNHLLNNKPDRYLDNAPMVIPMQGESPHGVFHIMHGGWRLYQKFIRAAANATLGLQSSAAVMDEPNVQHFNSQYWAMLWMSRACSEYLLHLSQTSGAVDIDLVPEFRSACERNVDLAYVFHYLFDFAFLVLDFKQGVRANQSKLLDLLWREFYSIGRTNTANKTQYVPMSIMRVFWAEALTPQLAELYHNLRALPMSERVYVGWDSPIEWLNGAISDGVSSLVSEERIAKFISNYSVMQSNYQFLLDATRKSRSGSAKMGDMESNVSAMKAWLIEKIGKDWTEATRANVSSNLGIGRGTLPWVEVQNTMSQGDRQSSVAGHVGRVVRDLTSSYYAFSE